MLGGLAGRADEIAKVLTVTIAPFLARLFAKVPKVGSALAPLTVRGVVDEVLVKSPW